MIEVHISTKFMTARYKQRVAALNPLILKAEAESAAALKKRAQTLSSGHLKTSTLRLLAQQRGAGIYSRRKPGSINPAIINVQTGRFRRSWMTRIVKRIDGTGITIWNIAPYGKDLLTGTFWSIPRPLLELLRDQESKFRKRRLEGALREMMAK